MFDGYVLIGGKSSRMGADKANLRLGDSTFARRARRALEPLANKPISLLTGESRGESFVSEGFAIVPDIFPQRGALGGLHAAFADSASEWIAVLACDFPFATTALFARLAAIARASAPQIAAVAPLQPDGGMQPLCALYRAAPCFNCAENLLAEQNSAPARRLLEIVNARLVDFAELTDLPGAEFFFFNVNTPADYRRARKIYSLDCSK